MGRTITRKSYNEALTPSATKRDLIRKGVTADLMSEDEVVVRLRGLLINVAGVLIRK